MTSEELQSIMPRLPAARNAELFPALAAAMAEFAIEAPARAAAFLAQLAHESAQLRFMEEIWGPTPAQRRYEPASTLATTLGNTETGDGLRYKGRGPIQITGRANYRRFGDLLGVDLIASPERAAGPDLAFRIAGLYWSKKGLNELADQATADAFREITRRINGGFNGLAERQQFYDKARAVLGVADAAPASGTSRGGPAPRAASARSLSAPQEEPAFDRGQEAIRTSVPPRSGRRPTVKRARKATATAKRKQKTGSTRRARKGVKAARPRRAPARRGGAAARRARSKKPRR